MEVFIKFIILGALITSCYSFDCGKDYSDDNSRLQKRLLCNYDKSIGPGTHLIEVNFNYVLKSFSFNDDGRLFTAQSYISRVWTDQRLKWDPNDFNGIKQTSAPIEDIWVPDITVYNSGTLEGMDTCFPSDCLIYYNGSVMCDNVCKHSGYCYLSDYTNWPFDIQQCDFEYMSRTRNSKQLNFTINPLQVDPTEALNTNSWQLVTATNYVGSRVYMFDKYNETYPFIIVDFKIKRQNTHLIHQVFITGAVIMITNIVLMLLDPNSNDRFVLYAINLFSHGIYIEQLKWMLPHNGDTTPKVLVFFVDSQFITIFLLFVTIFLKMHQVKQEKTAPWVKDLVTRIGSMKYGQLLIIKDSLETTDPNIRCSFRVIFDYFMICLFSFIYFFMFKKLMPLKSN